MGKASIIWKFLTKTWWIFLVVKLVSRLLLNIEKPFQSGILRRKEEDGNSKRKGYLMVIYKAKNDQDLSRKSANIISAQIIMKPDCVLGLATGSNLPPVDWVVQQGGSRFLESHDDQSRWVQGTRSGQWAELSLFYEHESLWSCEHRQGAHLCAGRSWAGFGQGMCAL